MLANNGFPLMNQTVLLKGVNDDPEILKDLFKGLLRLRVKPYYLYQGDLTAGASHFRTSLKRGWAGCDPWSMLFACDLACIC